MNNVITLASAGTYDIQSEGHVIDLVEIANDENSANNIYYGKDIPEFLISGTLDYGSSQSTSGSPIVTWEKDVSGVIRQGMLLSDDMAANFPAATKVLSVNGSKVTMSANATTTAAGERAGFSSVLTSDNGIPIAPGQTKSFTSAIYSRFLQQGFRILTATGETATVRLLKVWN